MSLPPATQARIISFGFFEVDLRSGELRKQGRRVPIQEKPFQLLALLLEHPGQIVTRDELRSKLWPPNVFVDFDHSVNSAIAKLRDALGDSGDSPLFVETVARRGYRFIAPVQAELPAGVAPPSTPSILPRRSALLIIATASIATLFAISLAGLRTRAPGTPQLEPLAPITISGHVIFDALMTSIATDGSRVYFTQFIPDGFNRLMVASSSGMHSVPLPSHFNDPRVLDVSRDGSMLLVRDFDPTPEGRIWIVQTLDGSERALSFVGHDARWSHDGQRMVVATGTALSIADADGNNAHKISELGGRAYSPRWSPDGKRIRFTLFDATNARSLWEVSDGGEQPRRLLSATNYFCCGDWTPDGRHFLYTARNEDRQSLWAVSEVDKNKSPVRLTSGFMDFSGTVFSADGRTVFATGIKNGSGTQVIYHPSSHRFAPAFAATKEFAGGFSYAPDGKSVAYVKDRFLWRSRVDGSDVRQLTSRPMSIMVSHWSPDGERIAFMGQEPNAPWRVFIISAEGGPTEELLHDWPVGQADPNWTDDGKSIIFGGLPDFISDAAAPKAIYIVNTESREVSPLPGSDKLFSPRISPDGKFVAAMTLDMRSIELFDIHTQRWTQIAREPADNPRWSVDGQYLYFNSGNGTAIRRIRIRDARAETVIAMKDLPDKLAGYCLFAVTPDDALLLGVYYPNSDIYSFSWNPR